MIHYFQAENRRDIKLLLDLGVTDIKLSYHDVRKLNPLTNRMRGTIPDLNDLRESYPKIDHIFLDCGSEKARKNGEDPDIDDYTNYCLKYQDFYTLASLENYELMIDNGCKKIIPLYTGDNPGLLKGYCKSSKYVALAYSISYKMRRLIFMQYPGIYFHGNNIISPTKFKRLRYHSIDSPSNSLMIVYGYQIDSHIRKAGRRMGLTAQNLLDSKNVKNLTNRRKALVMSLKRRLEVDSESSKKT